MHLPELLAPAGSPQAARAAVQNGADAIYLGGKQFSARQYADNFGDEEMEKILHYCHVYGVKVYVTVNTLIHNEEMEGALDYLRTLYNAGVDAVIMQDVGLIWAASKLLPGLTIHGSTQITINNSPGVQFLEEIGVKRVVLAREMSLEDIIRVKEQTNMELEIFVHGALCVAFSGQCLFSSMIGGRSGNRGRCAQPCRLPYSLIPLRGESGGKDAYSHLLSPKDLNLIEHLPQLIEAGISGLKIEGRMKRAEYVAVVVRAYRRALDRYAANPSGYSVSPGELLDLAQVFNREFTTGYLYGNPGQEMMSLDRPNNRGVFLGRVQKADRGLSRVTIKPQAPLGIGDEIEFWVTSGGRKEVKISGLLKENTPMERTAPGEQVEIELQSTKGIHPGDRVFKMYDAHLMSEARQSYTSPVRRRKIPLKLQVFLHAGEPLRLTAEDELGNQVTVSSEAAAEEAVKRPLTEDALRKQLDRMGNTPFEFKKIDFYLGEQVIIPVSEINKSRRKLVDIFEAKLGDRGQAEQVSAGSFQASVADNLEDCQLKNKGEKNHSIISISVSDGESANAAIEAGAGRVYLGGEDFRGGRRWSAAELQDLVSRAQRSGAQVYFALPRIWQENELPVIKKQIEAVSGVNLSGFSCSNLGSLRLLKSLGVGIIHGDYPLNVFNKQAACFFLNQGAGSYTLSLELNMQQIARFGIMLQDAECVVHGWPPLMVSRHCVLNSRQPGKSNTCTQRCRDNYGLKDRMNLTFPVKTDNRCRMYIFNSKELCLIENLQELVGFGVGYLRIEAKAHDARYAERVVSEYSRVLNFIEAGIDSGEAAAAARERLEESSPQGITKGHYFRGV